MNEKAGILPEVEKDKVVIVGQNEKKFEVKKWTIKNPHKGHTLWEINLDTGDIKPAEYVQVDMELTRVGESPNLQTIRKKVITKPNCIYISALNIKNAGKKFATQYALKWWKGINEAEQCYLVGAFFPDRNIHTIQNNEIEKLWHMENAANAKK